MKAKRRQLRDTQAFTLVELLVVISIILVLASLLAPTLARARQRAKSMSCASNLHQIGLATQMYWDDYNGVVTGLSGTFPSWTNSAGAQAWCQVLYPYLKTTKIYVDPGRPEWMPQLPVSYYLNLLPAYVEAGSPGTGTYPLNSKKISYSASFILMSEDLHESPQQEIDPTNETADRSGFSTGSSCFPPYHINSANFLFADSHVASFDHYDPALLTYWYTTMANWQ